MTQRRTTQAGGEQDAQAGAYLELDAAGRFSFLDGTAESLLGRASSWLLGRPVEEAFAEGADATLARACRRALAERVSVEVVEYHPLLGGWLEARIHPTDSGVAVSLRDVSERRESEIGRGALEQVLELVPSFHRGGTPQEVAQAVCRAALVAFGADAAAVWAVDDDGFRIVWREPGREDLPPGAAYSGGTWPGRA